MIKASILEKAIINWSTIAEFPISYAIDKTLTIALFGHRLPQTSFIDMIEDKNRAYSRLVESAAIHGIDQRVLGLYARKPCGVVMVGTYMLFRYGRE
jgi:hypothetical protein